MYATASHIRLRARAQHGSPEARCGRPGRATVGRRGGLARADQGREARCQQDGHGAKHTARAKNHK